MIPNRSVSGGDHGFSLLEMVVAVAILGMSLAALYQATGTATRIVGIDEKTAYSVELARSLLATYAVVPYSGMNETGETEGGFAWSVLAEPVVLPEGSPLAEGLLQQVKVVVRWQDGAKAREYYLNSIVAGSEADE